MKLLFGFIFMVFHVFYNPSNSGAIQLTSANIDNYLSSHEIVFINFYADWCHFSKMLAPVWDEAADKVANKFKEPGKVMFGRVDCVAESQLGTKFHITKYPTLKYVRNGQVMKREYRGPRSADSFFEFIEEEIRDPVAELTDLAELLNFDEKKRHLIGYFETRESTEYENFVKLSTVLKNDCKFVAAFGDVSRTMHPPGQPIVAFRPSTATSTDDDETYLGDLKKYDEFKPWATDKCTPLVREITFGNAEELTEEGLPFLILFHDPEDNESVKKYSEVVKSQLLGHKTSVNFLTADGQKFAHPIHHLGKSKEDLPLIAIDSFRHMYLFPKYEDINVSGKLEQFLNDLYSGKLHREFHYGPDPASSSTDTNQAGDSAGDSNDNANEIIQKRIPPDSPPPSQFQHLGPSKNRYTLLHDEF